MLTEQQIEAMMPNHGHVTWHCSEEGGGPDVGLTIGLGNGWMLWVGEISRSRWEDVPEAAHLGDDCGHWIILYGPDETHVIGKCVPDGMANHQLVDALEQAMAKLPIKLF